MWPAISSYYLEKVVQQHTRVGVGLNVHFFTHPNQVIGPYCRQTFELWLTRCLQAKLAQ